MQRLKVRRPFGSLDLCKNYFDYFCQKFKYLKEIVLPTLKNWIKKIEGNSTTPKNCVLTNFLHERSIIFLLGFSLIRFWILIRNVDFFDFWVFEVHSAQHEKWYYKWFCFVLFKKIQKKVRLIILGILSCGHSSKHFNKPLEPTIRNNGIDIIFIPTEIEKFLK